MLSSVLVAGCIASLLCVSIWDVLYRRVPNSLVLISFFFFLSDYFNRAGLDAIGPILSGVCVITTITFFIYFGFRLMGGADVKFAIAIAAWLGLDSGLRALIYGCILGGFIAVAILLWYHSSIGHNVRKNLFYAIKTWQIPVHQKTRVRTQTVPLAAAFAIGAAFVRFFDL